MPVKPNKGESARVALLEAAKKALRASGYSGLSTREVALIAGMPLSQIHYHFGSKDGMVLALFEYLNGQLLDRQTAMFENPKLKLSEQWDLACDYLEEDLASGFVQVLHELWGAAYSKPEIAKVIRTGILGWQNLITRAAERAETRFGSFSPLTPKDIASLVGTAFIGGEAAILIGLEKKGMQVRAALRRIGDLIRKLEGDVKR